MTKHQPDRATIEGAAFDWCAAWNARDLDRIMAHYADDVALSSPLVIERWGIASGWLHGKDRVRENFAIGVQRPNLRFDLIEVLHGAAGHHCILYRRETGRLVADLVELNTAGKAVRVVACYGTRMQSASA
jgi:hypothetical protein